MTNISDKRCRENQNTFYIFLTLFENRAVYEIMWKNIVEPDKIRMIIRRLRFACQLPKVTNTQSEYVILIAFPLQQWLHECHSVLRYRILFVLLIVKLGDT
jgi:hypothetical protein